MIGWEMAEILHIEILRKHGQTHTQTDRQTDMGITIPRPPPMGGEVINVKYVSGVNTHRNHTANQSSVDIFSPAAAAQFLKDVSYMYMYSAQWISKKYMLYLIDTLL